MDILSDVKIVGNSKILNGNFDIGNGPGHGDFKARLSKDGNHYFNGNISLSTNIEGAGFSLDGNKVFGQFVILDVPAQCTKFMVATYCLGYNLGENLPETSMMYPNITAWDENFKSVDMDYQLNVNGENPNFYEQIIASMTSCSVNRELRFAINHTFAHHF